MEVEKTGFNINNKIDIEETGKKYINYFYKCWNDDISTLINDNFIKKYTRFRYKNATHDYEDFLLFLEHTKKNNILNKMSINWKLIDSENILESFHVLSMFYYLSYHVC